MLFFIFSPCSGPEPLTSSFLSPHHITIWSKAHPAGDREILISSLMGHLKHRRHFHLKNLDSPGLSRYNCHPPNFLAGTSSWSTCIHAYPFTGSFTFLHSFKIIWLNLDRVHTLQRADTCRVLGGTLLCPFIPHHCWHVPLTAQSNTKMQLAHLVFLHIMFALLNSWPVTKPCSSAPIVYLTAGRGS